MLDLPRYLLGIAEIALLAGFATLGASALRARLLPDFSGASAHLATGVIALALLIWTAEILGSFGLFEPVLYVIGVGVIGIGTWALGRGSCRRDGAPSSPYALLRREGRKHSEEPSLGSAASGQRKTPHPDTTRGRGAYVPTLIALAIAAAAVIYFAADVRVKLGTGMSGFDSTWYHGPFAAGFFQSGNTWDLHFIAPQFLAWFYPANAEIFHAAGMLAFGRDVLSPLLNLGWLVGCLVACWCIGKPYRVAPWSLALGAIALSLPVLSDQAGEARNDVVGIFFLLAAVAIALNAWRSDSTAAADSVRTFDRIPAISANAVAVIGLAAGLAAGTKLNLLLPAAVLVLGLTIVAPAGGRWRALAAGGLGALAGGGYWYLRNLVHSGNPLPWFDDLGPISLSAPDQALGGRAGHSVLGYLTDGPVWSDWFLPGLHGGLTVIWPFLLAAALAGLLLAVFSPRGSSPADSAEGVGRGDGNGATALLRVAGLVGLAAALAWLIAPTSASGPEGMPRGFESGLRYLAPALALGLALLPAALAVRFRWAGTGYPPNGRILKVPVSLDWHLPGRGIPRAGIVPVVLLVLAAVAIGYPVQRHYLENRYADPTFAAPGLNAAFKWADSISGSRIATTSTRQYPLYGTDLSNHVQFVGEERPHAGFVAPSTCRRWRSLLNAGEYDYVITSRDRVEPDKPPYPPAARWTEGRGAVPILRTPPTVVFKLTDQLDPSAC
jgi:hypothetical protein